MARAVPPRPHTAVHDGLFTYVLIRYRVQDGEAQLATARRLIRKCVADGRTPFVPVPVTVTLELEWVLRASFECAKDDVMEALASLISAAEPSFESEQALKVALQLYRTITADFADCLHIALAAQAGQSPLWTFDRCAARVSGGQM